MNYTIDFSKIDIYEVIKDNINNVYIQIILNSLPVEEKEVIELRIQKKTRQYIADLKNTTSDRIRGIEERALKHLRHPARLQMINAIIDPNYIPSEKATNFFRK